MKANDSVKRVLAFDIGASNGRAMLGMYNGETISIQEIHRFSNDPVFVNGTLYWDVLRLFHEIKQGLLKARQTGVVESVGIDTWGVDFGLLDSGGMLMENPVHYRDRRTSGMLEKSFESIDSDEYYSITGNQFMEINTAFQLLSLKEKRRRLLESADAMLLMPDLLNYFLTGIRATEYTIASTTQLLDANKRTWSDKVINSLGIPEKLFTDIVPSGTVIGALSKESSDELGFCGTDIIAVCGHDTQSALVSVPSEKKDFAFISCGTWSLLGTELDRPIIDKRSRDYNITNEGAFDNRVSFLKNITGLWIVQECRRQWSREGREFSYDDLERMAETAEPFRFFIDTDDPSFSAAGDVPQKVREYCLRTGQPAPESEAGIVRCIYESLALKYRHSLEQIEECTGNKYAAVNMVGGGIKSKLLCSMTADACRRNVTAGPVEAAVFGNIAVQLIAKKEIRDTSEARKVIVNSQRLMNYTPQEQDPWNCAYKQFKEVTGC